MLWFALAVVRQHCKLQTLPGRMVGPIENMFRKSEFATPTTRIQIKTYYNVKGRYKSAVGCTAVVRTCCGSLTLQITNSALQWYEWV